MYLKKYLQVCQPGCSSSQTCNQCDTFSKQVSTSYCWKMLKMSFKRRPFNKMSGFQMVNAGGGGGRLKHKWQIALFCTFNMSMSSLTSLVFTYCYREASPRAPAKRALTTTRQLQWAVRYFLKLLNKF